MNRIFAGGLFTSGAVVALFLAAAPAQADTVWNTSRGSDLGQTGLAVGTAGTVTCPVSGASNDCVSQGGISKIQGLSGTTLTTQYGNEFTINDIGASTFTQGTTNLTGNGNGAQGLQVRSFYVDPGTTAGGSATTTTAMGLGLQDASLHQYGAGAGLGVTSKTVSTFSELVGNTPGHTIDNGGVFDIVAFKFPSTSYSVKSLVLNMFGSAPGAGLGNFTYFIGNGDATITSLASLSAGAGLSLNSLVTSHGFTEFLCDAAGSGGAGTNNCSGPGAQDGSGQNVTINSNGISGQYLIVAASLTNANRNDDFKVAAVDGALTTTKTPEPATLVLFASGGLMALRMRRRKSAAAA